MKLKGAAHAAVDRRRVVDSDVISNTDVLSLTVPFVLGAAKVLHGIRLGADQWAAVESTLTMTLMFPDF